MRKSNTNTLLSIEEAYRRKRRKGYLQHAVLSAIAVSGVLLIAMAAPNALQLLGKYAKNKRRFPDETRSALSRLAKKGLVVFEETSGRKYARITPAGEQKLAREDALLRFTSGVRRRWDGRYRLVMFDISERRKGARNRLASEMRSWGFLRLQDSVWLYPYDCEEIIALLKTNLLLGREVIYAIVEHMENDRWVRKHYNLPR